VPAGTAPSPTAATPTPAVTPAAPGPATPVIAAAAPVAVASAPTLAQAAPVTATPRSFIREVAGTARQTVALRPQAAALPQAAAGTTAPASQVFGAAIHAAAGNDERSRAEPIEPMPVAVAAPATVQPAATIADPAQPVLDMRQASWPNTMIDHIEALRDAANANDTRIRLVPDALGAIDVAVKTVGDTIHVRFTAEDATTRALIEDARPGLAAIAADRGLRIGAAIVEPAPASQSANGQQQQPSQQGQSGAGQSAGNPAGGQSQTAAQAQTGQQQQQQPRQNHQTATARQPAAPARASTPDTDAAADGRVG